MAVLGFPQRRIVTMNKNRFMGGIVLLVLSALAMLFLNGDASLPVAVTLLVVGVALIASGRRRNSTQ